MLCPEVWNFDPPPSHLKIKEGHFEKEPGLWKSVVENHYFNHFVSVALPDTVFIPSEIRDSLLVDGDYYNILNLPLSELINQEFLTAFVKKGSLFALSVGTRLDVDDCVALLPTGELILSLTKDTYQQLGLQGKPSSFCTKRPDRFVVRVLLKEDPFLPGKNGYERVQWCFKNRLDLTFSFILAWQPPGENICPSSVANFLTVRGFDVKVCNPRTSQRSHSGVFVPLLTLPDNCMDGYDMDEFMEWLGLMSLDAKFAVQDNATVHAKDGLQMGKLTVFNWSGLFTPKQLDHLISEMRSYMNSRVTSSIPWCTISVLGFEDCPVGWGNKEHTFYIDGTNMYTIIIKPDNNFMIQSTLSSTKKLK